MASWAIQVTFTNTGQRPAVDCQLVSRHGTIEVKGVTTDAVNIDNFDMRTNAEPSKSSYLGSGQTVHGETVVIDQARLQKIEEKKILVVLSGVLKYRDIIANTDTPPYESAIRIVLEMKSGADRWRDQVPFAFAASGSKYNYVK